MDSFEDQTWSGLITYQTKLSAVAFVTRGLLVGRPTTGLLHRLAELAGEPLVLEDSKREQIKAEVARVFSQ